MTKRTKLAVIGTGHWGPNLVRNLYEDPRIELKAICDMDRARATSVAAKYRDVRVVANFQEVANDSEIDAVVICTPTNTHREVAKACLENRKHVLVEKPMAASSDECHELNHLAERNNCKLMVGHIFLFNPAVEYVKRLIDRGELGDIVYLYGKRLNLGPIRKDVNAMWDLAPHDIAIFHYWLGQKPLSVNATGIQSLNPPLHDVVFASFKFPGNVMASLHVSWLDPRKMREIVVVGTRKMVVFDDLNPVGPVHIFDKTVTRPQQSISDTIQAFKAVVQEGDLVIPKIPGSEPLRNECRAFIDWIVDNKRPLCDGQNGLDVVEVLEAAQRSLSNAGREITLRSDHSPERNLRLTGTA